MNTDLVITYEKVLNGDEYAARPGLTYEVADGVRVKTKRHTVARVEQVEKVGQELAAKVKAGEKHLLDVMIEQAKLMVDVPEGFNWSRDTVDSTVAQRMVDDFFTSVYLKSRMPESFFQVSSQAANGSPNSEAGISSVNQS